MGARFGGVDDAREAIIQSVGEEGCAGDWPAAQRVEAHAIPGLRTLLWCSGTGSTGFGAVRVRLTA